MRCKWKKIGRLWARASRIRGIKQEWSCLLIGLERELLPIIHPDPNLRLNAGDLLWVLGEQRMGEKLLKEELIHN